MIKILTLKEEQSLTMEAKTDYYEKLREYALHRKLTNTTPGALTVAPRLKKATEWLAGLVTEKLSGRKGSKSRQRTGEHSARCCYLCTYTSGNFR